MINYDDLTKNKTEYSFAIIIRALCDLKVFMEENRCDKKEIESMENLVLHAITDIILKCENVNISKIKEIINFFNSLDDGKIENEK